MQNVGGAGGTLGATQVAKADARRLHAAAAPHRHVDGALALRRPRLTTRSTDFAPIGLVTSVPMTIIARKDFEPNTLAGAHRLREGQRRHRDLRQRRHRRRHRTSAACCSCTAIDTQLTTVPYQGTGPAMTDLLGGQVDFMCDQTTNTTGQIQGGEVKAYAVTTPERLAEPARPADHRRGRAARLPGRRLARALRARPAPRTRCSRSSTAALQAALADPTVAERFAELGTAPATAEEATPGGARPSCSPTRSRSGSR